MVEDVIFQSLYDCRPSHVFGCYQPSVTSETVSAAQDIVVSLGTWTDFAEEIKIDHVQR